MPTRGILAVLVLAAACGAGPGVADDGAADAAGNDPGPAGDPGPADPGMPSDRGPSLDPSAWPEGVATDPGDAAPTDPGDPPPPPPGCGLCQDNGDCGSGLRCLAVGATKHCLAECGNDGDCPKSHICYAASTAFKACLPVSYSCTACAFDTPCEDGKVCDLVSGDCKVGRDLCENCTYDFDCAGDLRCLKAPGAMTGVCVPSCGATRPCEDDANFTCGTTPKGVRLCLPRVAGECGGCPADRPFPAGDGKTCYGCLNDSHCDVAQTQVCDPVTHTCIEDPDGCGSGLMKCEDGFCKQCCRDEDCPVGEGPCTNGNCASVCDCCGASCTDPFPVCAIINNVAQCVQCKVDADCARIDPACGCSGDPDHACLLPDGGTCINPSCGARCTADADCPPGSDGAVLACSVPGDGVCFDARGTCDSMSACCGPGQACHSLGILTAMLPGPVPGFPAGACTCDDLHPCLGGGTCYATADLCLLPLLADILCPGGVPPATLPAHLCTDLAALLGLP